jgi:hypothetical protein
MQMTQEQAFAITRQCFTDDVMVGEKRRVFRMMQNKTAELLAELGLGNVLAPHLERMKYFQQFVHIPGDSIFASIQYVFNLARGEREADPAMTQVHVKRIYRALFTPAGLKNPVIPEMFWESPLGIACLIAEKGIDSAYPYLQKLIEE